MKTADIKVGEDYAIGTAREIKRMKYVQRGTVLATGAPRRVFGPGYTYKGKPVNDGVEVEITEGSALRTRDVEVVPPARVAMPWAEYARMKAEADGAELAAKDKRDAERARLLAEIDDHLGSYATTDLRTFIDRQPDDRLASIASLVEAAYLFGTSAP